MITPSALAQSSYYKIGDYVTFAWNYTSLSIKPNKIDVVVTCADNSATYPLATNATFQPTDTVVWDTAPDETGTAPLLMGEYTLLVYDAGQGPTAAAQAGRLGTSNNMMFGMYIPQKYTPRSGKPFILALVHSQDILLNPKYRLDMCSMQRCPLGHGTAGFEIHVRHVRYHYTLIYLVRQRPVLRASTSKLVTTQERIISSGSDFILNETSTYLATGSGHRAEAWRMCKTASCVRGLQAASATGVEAWVWLMMEGSRT